jgi:hypothetical protein
VSDYFELIEGKDKVIGRLPDAGTLTPFATEAILHWLRAGETVRYVRAEAAAPKREPKPKRTYARRAAKTDAVKPSGTWPMGARVYLRWARLDDDQKLHLSSYRTTAGVVEGRRKGYRTVRFNGDPPVELAITQISNVAEV